MKKIDLIEDRCIGCGACMSIAPETFTFNDEGRAKMINNDATEAAIEASETCPVSAIIVENCGCENKCNCEDNCNCTENDNCGCLENCSCGDDCNCSAEDDCGCKSKK